MIWIRYLAAGLCGGLLAWVLGAGISQAPPHASTPISGGSAPDPLLTELRALRAAIEQLSQFPPTPSEAGAHAGERDSSTRQDANQTNPATSDPVVVAIDGLQQALRAEFASLRANMTATTAEETGGLQALIQTRPPDNGDAVRQLCLRAETDSEIPIRELRFLSRREILARFGTPDEVGSDGDYWSWEIKSPDGTLSYLWTRFGAGYVTVAEASFEDGS